MAHWTLPKFENANTQKRDTVNQWILANIDYSAIKKGLPVCFYRNTSFYFISLPTFRNWLPEHKAWVFDIVVDVDMKDDLERSGLINWCHNVRRVVPIRVAKDGNCLLHSVGTAVWGITDRTLVFRKLLGLALNVDSTHGFHRRWKHQREMQISHVIDRHLENSNIEDLKREWSELCDCLDPSKNSQSTAYPHRFLESIHVYVLANILRRPIIVFTDPTMRTFSGMSLQDNEMGGIYLPLEWRSNETCRTPILIGYSQSHFAPLLFADYPPHLVASATGNKDLVPLVNSRFEQMPVRFLLPAEEPEVGELLRKYLRVKETVSQVNNVLCVELEITYLPNELNLVQDFMESLQKQLKLQNAAGGLHQHHRHGHQQCYSESSQHSSTPQFQGPLQHHYGLGDPVLQGFNQNPLYIPPPTFTPRHSFLGQQSAHLTPSLNQKCVVPTCHFFGDPELNMMCSHCFKNYTIKDSCKSPTAVQRALRRLPSAPLSTLTPPGEEEVFQMSMMTERCKEGCGFRCSVKTFPYCHECAGKKQRQASEEAKRRSEPAAVDTLVYLANSSETGSPRTTTQAVLMQKGILSPVVAPSRTMEMSQAQVPPSSDPFTSDPLLTSPSVTAGPAEKLSIPMKTQEEGTGIATSEISGQFSPLEKLAGPPLTPLEDTNDLMLFGSGQASPELMTEQPTESTFLPQHLSASGSKSQPIASNREDDKAEAITTKPGSVSCQIKSNSQPLSPQPAGPEAQQQNSWQPLRTTPNFIPDVLLSGEARERKNQNDWQPYITSPTFHNLSSQQQEMTGHKQWQELKSSSGNNSNQAEASVGAPFKCKSPNCKNDAVHRELCGQCYVGPEINPAVEKLKLTSLSTSSAPASVGTVSVNKGLSEELRRGGEGTAASPVTTFRVSESKGRASSLECLPTNPQIPAMSKVYNWLSGNRMVQPSQTQPLGLPDKEENEVLGGKDLIASGSHCCSSTIYCVAEGCKNRVPQEGQLCAVCKEILRIARLGPPSQGSQGSTRYCQTQNCKFFGKSQEYGYCSKCYEELVARQREAESQPAQPAVPTSPQYHQHGGMINVPPDFNFLRPVPKRLGQQCVTPGCTLYGDPKNNNMCTNHYRHSLDNISIGIGGSSNMPVSPSTQLPALPPVLFGSASQSPRHHQSEVNLKFPNASSVLMTPNTATVFGSEQSARVFATSETGAVYSAYPQGDVSVSPPSFPTPESNQESLGLGMVVTGITAGRDLDLHEPTLGEMYRRVAGVYSRKCLYPGCSNYGNPSKDGLCNSCAVSQRCNEEDYRRLILGDEQMG